MVLKIPIIFLGTSQAIPTVKRNHTAILVQYKNENILVDCGEGTQRQFRKANINPCKITKILITHWHGDHVLGIPGLFQTLALNGYNKTLQIYGPRGTKFHLNKILEIFVREGELKTEVHEVEEGIFFENEDFYLETKKMEHLANCNAYAFIEKDKIRIDPEKLKKYKIPNSPLIGEIQKGKDIEIKGKKIKAKDIIYKQRGRKISFILDTKINENCVQIAKNSDLLICEGVYLETDKEKAFEYKHLTARQAGEIAKKAKVKKLILTHLSQRYEMNEKKIIEEAKKKFKNVEIAHDLLKFEI